MTGGQSVIALFVFPFRIADGHLDSEAVNLRFRKGEAALALDRSLRCEHKEQFQEWIGVTVDSHLVFGHRLMECSLGHQWRTVDLIGQHDIREDWPTSDFELVLGFLD